MNVHNDPSVSQSSAQNVTPVLKPGFGDRLLGVVSRIFVPDSALNTPAISGHVTQIKGNWHDFFQKIEEPLLKKILKLKSLPDSLKSIIIARQDKFKNIFVNMAEIIFRNIAMMDCEGEQFVLEETYGVKFATNLLMIFKKHLKDPDPELRKEQFKNIANEILSIAFPLKENDPQIPKLLRKILQKQPPAWLGLIGWKTGIDFGKYDWQFLVDAFADQAMEFHDKFNAFSEVTEEDVKKFSGVADVSNKLTELVMKEIKTVGDVPINIKFLGDENDLISRSLKKLFGKISDEPVVAGMELVDESDEVVINETLQWFERTFNNAISNLLIKVLGGEGIENQDDLNERLHELVDAKLDFAKDQIPLWDIENEIIDACDHSQLVHKLGDIHGSEFEEKAKKLLGKIQEPHWEKKAREFLKKVSYHERAAEFLEDELININVSDYIPEFIPKEYVMNQIYGIVGNYLYEFHSHYSFIKTESARCDHVLAQMQISGLKEVLDTVLDKVTKFVEEQAKKREIVGVKKIVKAAPEPVSLNDKGKEEAYLSDEEGVLAESVPVVERKYEFLNEILCHLLEKSDEDLDNRAYFKEKIIFLIKDVIKIVFVQRIEEEIRTAGLPLTPQEAFKKIIEKAKLDADALKDLTIVDVRTRKINEYLALEVDWKNENDESRKATLEVELVEKNKELLLLHEYNNYEGSLSKLLDSKKQQLLLADSQLKKALQTEIQFLEKIFKGETRAILSDIFPENLFDPLLLPTMRGKKIWEKVSDELLFPYVRDFISVANNQIELKVNEAKSLINDYFPLLRNIFLKLRSGNAELDPFLETVLEENGQVSNFLDSTVCSILESILAHHINDENPDISTQKTIEFVSGILARVLPILRSIEPEKAKLDINALLDFVIPIDLWNRLVPESIRDQLSREFVVEKVTGLLLDFQVHFNRLDILAEGIKQDITSDDETKYFKEFLDNAVGKLLKKPLEANALDTEDMLVEEEPEKVSFLQAVIDGVFELNSKMEGNPIQTIIETIGYGIGAYYLTQAKKGDGSVANSLVERFETIVDVIQSPFDKLDSIEDEKQREEVFSLISDFVARTLLRDSMGESLVPLVASFIKPYLKSTHSLREKLNLKSQAIQDQMDQNAPQLKTFLIDKIITPIQEELATLNILNTEKFSTELVGKILSSNTPNLVSLRNGTVTAAVFVIFDSLGDPDAICEKVNDIIENYNDQTMSDKDLAKVIVDILVSDELWNDLLVDDKMRRLIKKELIANFIIPYITDLRATTADIGNAKVLAEAFLSDPKFKFIKEKLVDPAIESLEETLKQGQFATLPPFIKALINTLGSDVQSGPVIIDGVRSIVYIALHNLLKGPDWKKNVQDLFANIMLASNPPSGAPGPAQEATVAWLEHLLPQETLDAILPKFLHPVLTHRNISKWFLKENVLGNEVTIPELPRLDLIGKVLNPDYLSFAIKTTLSGPDIPIPAGDFAQNAVDKILADFFHGPVTFNIDKLKDQINKVVDHTQRVQFLTEAMGGKHDPLRPEVGFKKALISQAIKKVISDIDEKNWWAPLKWLVKIFARVFTWLYMQLSGNKRAYHLASSPAWDPVIKQLFWNFLHTPGMPIQPTTIVDLQEAIRAKATEKVGEQKLLSPLISKRVASSFAEKVFSKSILDFLS